MEGACSSRVFLALDTAKHRRVQAAYPRIVPGTFADRYFPLGLLLQGSSGSRPLCLAARPPECRHGSKERPQGAGTLIDRLMPHGV
jgi:hypothetical protein